MKAHPFKMALDKHHRRTRKQRKQPGLPPGTMVHVGDRKTETMEITLIEYSGNSFRSDKITDLAHLRRERRKDAVTWINIDGLHEVEKLTEIGRIFNLHPLLVEDVLDTGQRPKMEQYDCCLFVVAHMVTFNQQTLHVETEQVSIVLTDSMVLTFQERPGDVLEPLRDQLRNSRGRLPHMRADFLLYRLLDSIVDHYFTILEIVGDWIDQSEDELITGEGHETTQRIFGIKRELITLRRSLWPLREVVLALTRGESPQIDHETTIYLRDVADHSVQVIETLETYRDMLAGLLDMYMTAASNRMNSVMKTLTVIATIFIPLTFIVGVYGMNFDHMPELHWRWGYFMVWSVMIAVTLGLIGYFKKKGWF